MKEWLGWAAKWGGIGGGWGGVKWNGWDGKWQISCLEHPMSSHDRNAMANGTTVCHIQLVGTNSGPHHPTDTLHW